MQYCILSSTTLCHNKHINKYILWRNGTGPNFKLMILWVWAASPPWAHEGQSGLSQHMALLYAALLLVLPRQECPALSINGMWYMTRSAGKRALHPNLSSNPMNQPSPPCEIHEILSSEEIIKPYPSVDQERGSTDILWHGWPPAPHNVWKQSQLMALLAPATQWLSCSIRDPDFQSTFLATIVKKATP